MQAAGRHRLGLQVQCQLALGCGQLGDRSVEHRDRLLKARERDQRPRELARGLGARAAHSRGLERLR